MEQLLENYAKVQSEVANDRAILRAIHYFNENDRVERAVAAAEKNDGKTLLAVLDESGRSSWELLQNCYAIADYKEQKIALALALTEHFLKKIGDGLLPYSRRWICRRIVALIPRIRRRSTSIT